MTIRIDGTNTAANPGITGTDTDTGLQFGTDEVNIVTGGSTRATVDSSGRLLVGTSTARNIQTHDARFQVDGADYNNSTVQVVGNADSVNGSYLFLGKSRGTTAGSNTVVQNGDDLGEVRFYGADGTGMIPGARIQAQVDGTPGTNDMPGRLVFSTTADGASSSTERMRIEEDGRVGVNITASTMTGHSGRLGIYTGSQITNDAGIHIASDNSGSNTRGFLICSSNYSATRDTEFALNNDGNAYADGSWNGGGADYAEYFEWSDGNTTAEDRRGISVVLDGNKIREAVADEEPIGVISGNPSVVGDAAWNKWNGKYLRDDFGTYIRNAEGERQLNPDFDPDIEYIPREGRSEWDAVGLIGKLRIRKGQITGTRWIKMRDISDTVEEWLVR